MSLKHTVDSFYVSIFDGSSNSSNFAKTEKHVLEVAVLLHALGICIPQLYLYIRLLE